jgi:hypothetical protein
VKGAYTSPCAVCGKTSSTLYAHFIAPMHGGASFLFVSKKNLIFGNKEVFAIDKNSKKYH